jgi:MoxR-like ATPase
MLLADEINRTSPKTQSALLEAMEEHNVTVDGNTYKLPEPFVVIATQNPFGEVGTQMLPETQMDRFMISTKLGYPDMNSEIIIAKTLGKQGRAEGILPVLTKEELLEIQNKIYNIFVNDVLYRYIVKLVRKTRENNMIERGASTRAVIALVKLSKTAAWLNNRNYVIPEDIIRQYKYVIQHRITLNSTAGINHLNKQDVIDDILDTTKAPAPGKTR